jgi:hypothetical protein
MLLARRRWFILFFSLFSSPLFSVFYLFSLPALLFDFATSLLCTCRDGKAQVVQNRLLAVHRFFFLSFGRSGQEYMDGRTGLVALLYLVYIVDVDATLVC